MELHINTYGTYLHVKDQLFEIKMKKDGKEVKQHLAAHKVKSILMGKGTALSTDAIHLALKNNIDLLFVEYDGFPIGRVWHSKLGSTTKIRKAQLSASLQPLAIDYTKNWVGDKLANQQDFLQKLKKHRKGQHEYINERIGKIRSLSESLALLEGNTIASVSDTIRGLEGTAGRIYFGTLSTLLAEQYQFNGRSFRPALDAFNAFLNYAYGILYSKVEKALIIAGIDPFLGFLHRDDYNHKSMVYDFIEPFRVFAEIPVFTLFSSKKVKQSHTDKLQNGVRLNHEGKIMLVEKINQHWEEEKVRYHGKNQTRLNIIQLEAHQFAQSLLNQEA